MSSQTEADTAVPASPNRSIWRVVLRALTGRYRTQSLIILAISQLNALLNVAAAGALFLCIRQFEQTAGWGDEAAAVTTLPLGLTAPDWISQISLGSALGLLAVIFAASAAAALSLQLLATRYARRFFEDEMQAALDRASQGRSPLDQNELTVFLARDARYLSMAYSRIIMILQPGLALIAYAVVALLISPLLGAVALAVFAAIAPVQLIVARYGAQAGREILASAVKKNEEGREAARAAYADPLRRPVADFNTRSGVSSFLSAYVKRLRLGAYSDAAVNIGYAAAAVVLAFLAFGQLQAGAMSLAQIIVFFVIIRLVLGAIGSIANTMVFVRSLEPYLENGLRPEAGPDAWLDAAKFEPGPRAPVRILLFTGGPADWPTAARLAQAATGSPDAALVSEDFDLRSADWRSELGLSPDIAFDEALAIAAGADGDLGEAFQRFTDDIEAGAEPTQRWRKAPGGLRAAFALRAATLKPDSTLVITQSAYLSLGMRASGALLRGLGSRPFILLAGSVSSSLVLPTRFQVYLDRGSRLDLICDFAGIEAAKAELRDGISIDRRRRYEAARTAPGAGTEDGFV
ncbi:MAG: hypothetical protein AAFX09_12160 [Pseudomonadota bacterium]